MANACKTRPRESAGNRSRGVPRANRVPAPAHLNGRMDRYVVSSDVAIFATLRNAFHAESSTLRATTFTERLACAICPMASSSDARRRRGHRG